MKCYIPVPSGVETQTRGVSRRSSPASGAQQLIGFVDDCLDPPFTERLAELLGQRVPGATVRVWKKPSGTAPSPRELIEEVASTAQAAVVGIGL